jgi:hypothetical protein
MQELSDALIIYIKCSFSDLKGLDLKRLEKKSMILPSSKELYIVS